MVNRNNRILLLHRLNLRKKVLSAIMKTVLVNLFLFLSSLSFIYANFPSCFQYKCENSCLDDKVGLSEMKEIGMASDERGLIQGVVKDAQSGETLPFAAIQVVGSSQGVVSSLDGEYSLSLQPGNYTIRVSFASYESQQFANVEVVSGQNTLLNVNLSPALNELQAVKVVAKRVHNTEAAVVTSMKQADVVATGASSQLISRSQSKDAAEVVSKLSGVSVEEGSFINVRGLNVRYNSVLLNGTTAPGTENDSRAFALDAIAGNTIDHLMLYKTASAELPADFSGGLVSIITKGMPQENALQVSYSIGVNTQSIGRPYTRYSSGSPLDYLAMGATSRDLPDGFAQDVAPLSNEEKAECAKALDNDWSVVERKSLPSQSFSFQWDNVKEIGKDKNVKFGSLLALNYGYSEEVREPYENIRFGIFDRLNEQPTYLNHYTDEEFSGSVKLNALGNLGWQFQDGSMLEFKNIFSQTGKDRTAYRQGVDYNNEYHIKEQEFVYTQRTLYVGQLLYSHQPADGHKLDYRLTYGLTHRQEPDRRLVTFRQQTEPGQPHYGEYKATDVNRFYQDMKENMVSGGIDYKGKMLDQAVKIDLLSGLAMQYKYRDFSGRKFLYTSGFPSTLPSDFLYQDLTEIFNPGNMHAQGYFLDENTRKSDAYTASTFIPAAYASMKLKYEGLQMTLGARAEYEHTLLDGYSSDGSFPILVNRSEFKVFPSFNASYDFNDKHKLRLAYAYTVNRPELREIAPYVYYDFDRFADYTGNPDLKNADIQNVDFRYEFYPESKDVISLGCFYKYFVNPIELSYIRSSGGSALYTFKNADFAYSYGLELEIRKDLSFMKLKNFSLVANAAWIMSQVRFKEEDFDRDRAMQGQSPYLVNAGLYYEYKGWSLSLLYNHYGKRILAVGEVYQNPEEDIPDIYEMPRHDMSFGLKKKIGKRFELKFLASNLLNQAYTECQFVKLTANDGSEHTVKQTPRSYKTGIDLQLGLTLKL